MALSVSPAEIIESGEYPLLVIHNTWERVPLGLVATVQNGFPFESKCFDREKGVPLIRIRDVTDSETEHRYTGKYDPEFLVHHGDILIGMDGGFKAARWKGNGGLLNQRVCRVSLSSKHYDEAFLVLCLQPYLNAINAKTSSVTVKHLSSRSVEQIPLPLPPLREQRRIVAKIEELFSELDNGIKSLTAAREQLNAYRQAFLKHAFKGKLTEYWRVRNGSRIRQPSELLGDIESYKGSQAVGLSEPEGMPHLPDSWTYVRAEDLCDFITKGTTPSKDLLFAREGDIPFIKVYNLTFSGALDFSVDPTFTNTFTHKRFLARSKVYPNDVLMNIVGPPLGKVSVVPDLYPEWNINQAIAIFRTRFLRPRILAAYLAFECTQRVVARKAKATAGQFNLTLEICRDIPIPLFDMEEQRALEERLDQELCTIASLDKEFGEDLARCEALRQSILKQAFSGQLVPQDPKDEPASVLLECIRAEREGAPTKKTRNGKNGQKSNNGKKTAA